MAEGLRAMLQRNAPFSIKLRWDWELWSWLLQFARRCNHRDMMQAAGGIQALLESSSKLYPELIAAEDLDCQWQTRGLLFVYQSARAWDAYAKTDELLREHFDEPAVRYDGEALLEFEPAFKPGLAGAWYYPHDSHLRPEQLMASWRKNLETKGVRFCEQCKVVGLASNAQKVQKLRVLVGGEDRQELEASQVVVAAGAWAPQLAELVGVKLPIQPGKGYSLTTTRPALCPQIPMLLPEHRVGVTPLQNGYRLGSIMEFAGYDSSIRQERLDLLKEGASCYLREPYGDFIEDRWYGWRPMTYDGKPIIDQSPRWSNVWIATGHNMLGLSMAPATGKLLAEMLCRETPHIDPAPYEVGRF